jgi:hypothetical protein
MKGHNWSLCRKCGKEHKHSLLGHNLSEETKRKISESLFGKHHSEETKEKMRKAGKRRRHTEETKKLLSVGQTKRWEDPKYRITFKGRHHSEETKKKMSLTRSGKTFTEEHKRKISESLKTEENIKKMIENTHKRPTGYEKKIIDLCEEYHLPFKYVGDEQVIICYRNPDFIETNGRKLLIETYCAFWHTKDYAIKREKLFAKYGFRTLFLNDDDLNIDNWKEVCLRKINEFLR